MELKNTQKDSLPNYIIFIDDENLDERIENIKPLYSNLTFEAKNKNKFYG